MRGRDERTIIVVITHDYFLRLTILAHFAPKVLVEGVKVILQLAGIHLVLGIVGGVLVEVGQEDGLRIGGLNMFSRAAIPVPACADFIVEGAVDFVLFCAENRGEVAGGIIVLVHALIVGFGDLG